MHVLADKIITQKKSGSSSLKLLRIAHYSLSSHFKNWFRNHYVLRCHMDITKTPLQNIFVVNRTTTTSFVKASTASADFRSHLLRQAGVYFALMQTTSTSFCRIETFFYSRLNIGFGTFYISGCFSQSHFRMVFITQS